MSIRRQLHLDAFLKTVGHHESAWRFPEWEPLAAWDVKHYALRKLGDARDVQGHQTASGS
jgi:hypothetical protein